MTATCAVIVVIGKSYHMRINHTGISRTLTVPAQASLNYSGEI